MIFLQGIACNQHLLEVGAVCENGATFHAIIKEEQFTMTAEEMETHEEILELIRDNDPLVLEPLFFGRAFRRFCLDNDQDPYDLLLCVYDFNVDELEEYSEFFTRNRRWLDLSNEYYTDRFLTLEEVSLTSNFNWDLFGVDALSQALFVKKLWEKNHG